MDFSNITTPKAYLEASFLAREAAKELFNRLDLMKLQPKRILDVGCGLGMDTSRFAERYPEAQVYGLDLAEVFLQYGKKQVQAAGTQVDWIVADSHSLPLRSHSVDLIFANLLLPWVEQPAVLLREWRRILRPQGLVLFSCLGPDTFQECTVEAKFLPGLVDMHNVGDALLREGFVDPVLEVENLTLAYRSEEQLQCELTQSGMQKEETSLGFPAQEAVFPVTFELVYGHAFCPATKGFKPDDQGVVKIPLSQLKKSGH
jgi:malonyl-CoA O-methyltransferase